VTGPEPDPAALRGAVVTWARRRWIGPTLAVLLVLGLVVGLGGDRLYVRPSVDHLAAGEKVDAVIALGGLIETATYAQQLVQQGAAGVLVLSDPYPAGSAPTVDQACAARTTGYRVICFQPDPSTTRGEAREIRALAERHGWTRIAVIAPSFHVSRARLLVERCYPGTLLLLELPESFPWYNWTYQYVRQTAGFAKAAVMRSC
jgi:uncharacterized SAM-binding protein YcdF (DUF218 family)